MGRRKGRGQATCRSKGRNKGKKTNKKNLQLKLLPAWPNKPAPAHCGSQTFGVFWKEGKEGGRKGGIDKRKEGRREGKEGKGGVDRRKEGNEGINRWKESIEAGNSTIAGVCLHRGTVTASGKGRSEDGPF